MRFVLDENIPQELIAWLEEKGHNIFSVPKGIPDEEVTRLTKDTFKGILLTQDRHFTNTSRFPPEDFLGIARIRIHPSYIEDITFALDKLLHIFTNPEDFKGKLIILEKYGFFKFKE